MAKAFDLWHPDAMGQGIGDIDSEFQSFNAGLTNVQRAELGSRLDEALKDDAATGILMSKLQENND
jgi:hypothetical protein